MPEESRPSLKFLQDWVQLAGFVVTIVAAIAFSAKSILLSVAMIVVGWALALSYVLRIASKRVRETGVAAVVHGRRDKRYGPHAYPFGIRLLSIIGAGIFTAIAIIWVYTGVSAGLRRTSSPHKVQLSSIVYEGITASVAPGEWVLFKFVPQSLDHTLLVQTYEKSKALQRSSFIWLTISHNRDVALLTINGTSANTALQVSNKVPIRVLSYRPITDTVDIIQTQTGGPGYWWLFYADISDQVLLYPDQTTWATFSPEPADSLIHGPNGPAFMYNLPVEVQNAITSGEQKLPDYFQLENEETFVFNVATRFTKPGFYVIQFGVEYTYKNYRAIAWMEPPIEVIVLQDFYVWSEQFAVSANDSPIGELSLYSVCTFQPADPSSGYRCLGASNPSHSTAINEIIYSPDGQMIASSSNDGTIRLWDVATGDQIGVLGQLDYLTHELVFYPDSTKLVSAGDLIRVWDLSTGNQVFEMKGLLSGFKAIALSPYDFSLASGAESIKRWSLENGAELSGFYHRTGWIQSLAFSPDGRLLAYGSSNGTIEVLDSTNGSVLRRFDQEVHNLEDIVFAPSGQRLAYGSSQGVNLIDIKSGELEAEFKVEGNEWTKVHSLDFSSDGSLVAAVVNGEVYVWNTVTSELIVILGEIGQVEDLAFAPTNSRLAVCFETEISVLDTNTWAETLRISAP